MATGLAPVDRGVFESAALVRRLVVALDGSAEAERVLAHARRLADLVVLGIELVVVVEDETDRDRAMEYLSGIPARGPVEVHRVVVADRPADGLVEVLGLGEGVLGCAASHARDRSALVVGSVVEEVLGQVDHPMLVAGPSAIPATGDRGPVVAAVSGRTGDDVVVATAAGWARRLGVPLVLVTVVEPTPDPVVSWHVPERAHGPAIPDDHLAALADTCRSFGVEVSASIVKDPLEVAGPVVAEIGRHRAELVVIGRRRHHALHRFALGDHAARLVHASTVPALVVPVELRR